MEVRMFTVGLVQENCFLLRRDGADEALIVDPGDEAPRILEAVHELGLKIAGILVTHCHFDHVGAGAPGAKATGAPGWVSEIERLALAHIMSYLALARL